MAEGRTCSGRVCRQPHAPQRRIGRIRTWRARVEDSQRCHTSGQRGPQDHRGCLGRATGNIARTAKSTSLGIADRLTTGLTTVLVLCIQALWGGLAFTVVITTSLAYGVGSSVTLLGILLWVLGAAIIAFTPRALRASAARRRN